VAAGARVLIRLNSGARLGGDALAVFQSAYPDMRVILFGDEEWK
jgi:hypothetical protein